IAGLAALIEFTGKRAPAPMALLIAPLPRMTMLAAAFAGLALVIPAGATSVVDRAALPANAALLTLYYGLRSRDGARWERITSTIGPGIVVGGIAFAAGADLATLGLVSVVIGCLYLLPELVANLRKAVVERAAWAAPETTAIGLA